MTAFNLIASFSVFTVFRQFLQSVRHPSLRPFTPFPQIEWSHHSPELNFLLGRVESWSNFTNITWTSTLSFAYAGPQILFHDLWPAVLCDGVCQRGGTLLPLVQRETILRGVNIIINCGFIVDPNSIVLRKNILYLCLTNRPKTWQGISAN